LSKRGKPEWCVGRVTPARGGELMDRKKQKARGNPAKRECGRKRDPISAWSQKGGAEYGPKR